MSDYVFKPGQEYRTRGGLRARVYATDGAGNYPIHGAVENMYEMGQWWPMAWSRGGLPEEDPPTDNYDLLPPEPEKVTQWVNVYRDGGFWDSRKEADEGACCDRIACIRITYHEGQYDE